MTTVNSKGIRKIVFKILIAIVVLFLLYHYPLQRYLAINKFKDYIAKQGATQEDIIKRDVFKNYKDGGYTILVKYKDQDRYLYGYNYFIYTHKRNEDLIWNRMFCHINDLKSGKYLSQPYPKDVKNLPLKDE